MTREFVAAVRLRRDALAVVDVDAEEIDGLGDELEIAGQHLWDVGAEEVPAVLRVFAAKNRFQPPRHGGEVLVRSGEEGAARGVDVGG